MHNPFSRLRVAATDTITTLRGAVPTPSSRSSTPTVEAMRRVRASASTFVSALGLIAGLFMATPAKAGTITWNLVNVATVNFKFTGSFTADSITGLVQSTNILDQYFNDTPISLATSAGATLTYPTGQNNQFGVTAAGPNTYELHLILTNGETFADDVPTLALSYTSSERTSGCCQYLLSGSLSNESLAAPEPASLALFGVGAAVLGMVRRRRA